MAHCPVVPCHVASCREDRNGVYPRGTARWANATYCELSPIPFRSSKLYSLISSHTDLAIRLANPALALRKLSLSPPGPSARKTWAKTLMQLCHLWRAVSTERERVTGGRMAGALHRGDNEALHHYYIIVLVVRKGDKITIHGNGMP